MTIKTERKKKGKKESKIERSKEILTERKKKRKKESKKARQSKKEIKTEIEINKVLICVN